MYCPLCDGGWWVATDAGRMEAASGSGRRQRHRSGIAIFIECILCLIVSFRCDVYLRVHPLLFFSLDALVSLSCGAAAGCRWMLNPIHHCTDWGWGGRVTATGGGE